MKIAVIGGNGNIGSHIVQELLKDGNHEVICSGRGEQCKHPVSYIQGDRHNTQQFINTMQQLHLDAAIDLTCFSSEDATVSIQAFRGVEHFLTASTVCTYGKSFTHLPLSEDEPFTPWTEYGLSKHAADQTFLEAHRTEQFPVTILKPGTTYSHHSGMLRMLNTEHSWIDRIRKGKPLLVCGDGNIFHQYMHAEDTARGFTGVLGKKHCHGQVYNVLQDGYITWADYHKTAMKLLGNEVELVGLPLPQLMAIDPQRFGPCYEIFGQHSYFSNGKLRRDVPEWSPQISLEEGMGRVFREMDAAGAIPDCSQETWEDDLLEKVKQAYGSLTS